MAAVAESIKRYSRFFKTQNAMDVLDYGTGTMRNAVYMAKEGFSVYAAVFNIIMNSADRHAYLDNAVANLKAGGYLLMEVRCRKSQEQCNTNCKDFFACDECSKTLTHEELDDLLNPHGLDVSVTITAVMRWPLYTKWTWRKP